MGLTMVQNVLLVTGLVALAAIAAAVVWTEIKAEEKKLKIKKESEQAVRAIYDGVGMTVNCGCGDCVKNREEADNSTWEAMKSVMEPAPVEMKRAARKTLEKTKKKIKKKGKKPRKKK